MEQTASENSDFAARLRSAREGAGLNQTQLAKMVGVRANWISRLEKGIQKPRADLVGKLATALGVSAEYLLGTEANSDLERPALRALAQVASKLDDRDVRALTQMAIALRDARSRENSAQD